MMLTLGVLSLVLPVLGLVAAVAVLFMASSDLKKMRAGTMDDEGRGNTQAGWVCGLIGVVIQSFICLACGAYVALVFAFVNGVRNMPPTKLAPVPVQPGPMQPAFKKVS
jgi:hypothetical protein